MFHRLCSPNPESFRAGSQTGVRIRRMKGTAERQALPPRIYEGGGPRSGRASPPRSGDGPLSHGFAVPALPKGEPGELRPDNRSFRAGSLKWRENPPDERDRGTTSLAPRIYEGGGPRSGRGSLPPPRGKPPQSRLCRAGSPRGEAEGASHRSCPPHL